jgi:two-component system, chemotaxis family, chemotaxis protein CheY
LVVDDDASLRQLMAALVEQAGFESLQAQDGPEALQVAENNRIDLLLTDVEMPGIDGLELIRILKDRGLVARTLIVTGNAGRVPEPTAAFGGALPLLAKPFTPQQLVVRIRALLDSPALRGQ